MKANYRFTFLPCVEGGSANYSICALCSIVAVIEEGIRFMLRFAAHAEGNGMKLNRDKHSNSVETEMTGWVSIHINDKELPAPLAERFPRLAFSVIALSLLISVLTAEFDYLRGAGYYWP